MLPSDFRVVRVEGDSAASLASGVAGVSGGRTVGYCLVGGAGLLALLMLAWLAVSGARGGGVVLGLILLVVLAGPLGVAGLVVLRRQPAEAAAEAAFASKRRVLDSDRLFRREIAPELRQLAHQPGLPSARLEDLAADLERSTYDGPEWYDAVQLGDDDVQTLKRYEDLVWDRVRLLRDRATSSAAPAELQAATRELEQALDQRRDLLVRGKRAPGVAPSTLLRAGAPARGLEAVQHLGVGDAVTSDGVDYVVEGLATAFAEGQTWKLAHLTPAGAGEVERWLYVGPAGLELALLDEAEPPSADDETVPFEGRALPRVAAGTATVDVDSQAGSARGVLVSFARYAAHSAMGLVERWPDGARHAYLGRCIKAADLEVWPANDPSAATR
jgi:hypothetical protein